MGNLNTLRSDVATYDQNGSITGGEYDANAMRTTILHYHNGDRYEGQICRNLREGYGQYVCGDKDKRSNYEYIGQWKNNLREGPGKCFFYNGDFYVGDWK